MHENEGPRIAGEDSIPNPGVEQPLSGLWPGEGLREGSWWDSEATVEELCEQILRKRPELEERELWRELAAYRGIESARCGKPAGVELASADRPRLAERIRLLIGRLPEESLEDFSGLVAFTETFLSRVQFVCDLVVYLFAEREKGLESEGTEGRRYAEFFVQKLMWELDVVSRIAEQQPLSALEGEYLDWLADRILDGEVLI
jgi:hypothetical protein